MVRIRQVRTDEHIRDVATNLRAALEAGGLATRIKPGQDVALTAGSRGIAQIATIIKTVAEAVKDVGATPFVVPAMGSHGGATAEGQRDVLASYGITPESVGCDIRSSMDVVNLGTLPNGAGVYFDRYAFNADATIAIGRVKPHTAYRAPIESGLCKMVAVGLGKRQGADSMHSHGLGESIPLAAALSLRKANVALGVAIVENAYDKVHTIKVVPPEAFHATDRELLRLASKQLLRVPFDHLDLLVVDYIGKNISGSGLDYNIIGMWRRLGGEKLPMYKRIAVLNLTRETDGNALGLGAADFTTRRVVEQIDYEKTYLNVLTENFPDAAKVPIALPSDRDAIEVALRSASPQAVPRIAHVQDTLHLEEMEVSEGLTPEVRSDPRLDIVGELHAWAFDGNGNLSAEHALVQAG
jgi:hypothetical protein